MSNKEYELFDIDDFEPEKKEENAATDSPEPEPDDGQVKESLLSAEDEAVPERPRRKKRRAWAFPLGLLIIALAITGIYAIASSAADFIRSKTDDSQQRLEYTQMLTWVVANDPDTFDDISKANPEQLRDIAIMSLLYDDINTGEYELSEKGLLVPAADVERYYVKLFGSEVPCTHGQVNGYGYVFEYDEQAQTYSIPITGITPPYTPRVTGIKEYRDTVVLTVGYIGTDGLQVDVNGEIAGAQPVKYMNITLRKTEGEFRIASVQSASAPETDAFN